MADSQKGLAILRGWASRGELIMPSSSCRDWQVLQVFSISAIISDNVHEKHNLSVRKSSSHAGIWLGLPMPPSPPEQPRVRAGYIEPESEHNGADSIVRTHILVRSPVRLICPRFSLSSDFASRKLIPLFNPMSADKI
jgi:hypothetical protein